MNVMIAPLSHYCIILDKDDTRPGNVVITAYIATNHIFTLDAKWQNGRLPDGRRTVNFIGFPAEPIPEGDS